MKIAVCQRVCPEYIVPLFERLSQRWDITFVFSLFGKHHTFFFNPAVVGNIRAVALPSLAFPRLPSRSRAVNKLAVWTHMLVLAVQLARELSGGDYDVLIGGDFGRFECAVAWMMARRRRRRFVLWSDAWHWPVTRRDRWRLPLVRRMIRDADVHLAGGSLAKAKLVELGADEARIVNVYHTNVVPHVPSGPPAGPPFVLYVGRLDERKGVEYLIRAFARVRCEVPGLRLKVAGIGVRRDSLARLAGELGVTEAIDFLGWVEHGAVDALYRTCAVFVLPSIFTGDGGYEPFSNVVLEAMAWGRPVIATTANGASFDVITDGVNGLVVPDRDAEALARALRVVLTDRERAEAMGRRGWETIRDVFNVDRMADRFSEGLTRLGADRLSPSLR